MQIKISNGRFIDPANQLDKVTDIYIRDDRIAAIGKQPANFKADKKISAKNLIIIPGLVDLCTRMGEPGQEHKATIKSESDAAVAGGVTSVCCPPDTDPIIDTPAVAELIHQRAQHAAKCHVYPVAAATHGLNGKTLSEMQTLKDIGCIAISNAYAPIVDSEVLRRVMEYAFTVDMTLMLFCEDDSLRNKGTAHEGSMSMSLGLPGIPETAETTAISRAILLAEQSGVKLHVCRISTARGVNLINDAQARGLKISADVSIQHLYFTEQDLANFNSQCHLRPPLRTESDRQALLQGLKDKVISSICSDHQPQNDDAKSVPFSLTEPGASSIEFLLPLALSLENQSGLDLVTLIKTITSNPANVLNIEAGNLAVGHLADLCIFDPNKSVTISRDTMISAGKNTPYQGLTLNNTVIQTIMSGNIVY